MTPRGARRPKRRVAVLSVVLGVLALAVGPLGPTAGRASPITDTTGYAAVPTSWSPPGVTQGPGTSVTPAVTPLADRALITVTSVTPPVVTPGDTVTITGSVTAPTSGPLTGPRLRLVLGSAGLAQRSDVATWATAATAASGRELTEVTLPTVAPSQSVSFTLTVPRGAVDPDEPFDALPVALEVRQAGASTPIGTLRTFLTWHARKEYEPLQVATVLPLTLDPDLDLYAVDADTRDAAWQAVIGPGSRVRRIVEGTRNATVTLAVDPTVFGPYAGTSNRTRTGTGDPGVPGGTSTTPPTTLPTTLPTTDPGATGTPPPGTPSTSPTAPTAPGQGQTPAVAAAVTELAQQLRERSLWALPYADADVAAAAAYDPGNSLIGNLVDRSSRVSAVVRRPVRSDILWPVDGLLPDGRERALASMMVGTSVQRPAAIVVDQRAITAASQVTPTARRVASGGTRLLGYDAMLSNLLPQRSDPSPVLSVQRFLAETLVLVQERAGTRRSVLVATPRTYDPEPGALAAFFSATSAAPWIAPVDAATLLTDLGSDSAVVQQRPPRPFTSPAPVATLTSPRLSRITDARQDVSSVSEVLRDGELFEQTYGELLDELASVRWRYQPTSWSTFYNKVVSETRSATSAIKVVARNVNFFAETGVLQVTVENGLDYEVAGLRLQLAPTNPRMQIVEQPAPITIGPASKTVVRVPVTVVAAGRVDVRAFLTTGNGSPIGSPAVIPISANPIDGAIYWIGGVLVGLVLLLGVARSLTRGTSRIEQIGDLDSITGDRTDAANRP